jgi:hypothetical protein
MGTVTALAHCYFVLLLMNRVLSHRTIYHQQQSEQNITQKKNMHK